MFDCWAISCDRQVRGLYCLCKESFGIFFSGWYGRYTHIILHQHQHFLNIFFHHTYYDAGKAGEAALQEKLDKIRGDYLALVERVKTENVKAASDLEKKFLKDEEDFKKKQVGVFVVCKNSNWSQQIGERQERVWSSSDSRAGRVPWDSNTREGACRQVSTYSHIFSLSCSCSSHILPFMLMHWRLKHERERLPTGLKALLTHSLNLIESIMHWKLKHKSGLLPMGFVQYLFLCCCKWMLVVSSHLFFRWDENITV